MRWSTRVPREAYAVLFGKYPHPQTVVPGGMSSTVTVTDFNETYTRLHQMIDWTKRMNQKGYASIAQLETDKQTFMTQDLALQQRPGGRAQGRGHRQDLSLRCGGPRGASGDEGGQCDRKQRERAEHDEPLEGERRAGRGRLGPAVDHAARERSRRH